MRKIIVVIIAVLSVFTLEAQEEHIAELTIIDTSVFNGKKIYIFSDYSWAYAYKIKDISSYITKNDTKSIFSDTTKLFSFNWLNGQSHVKTVNLSSLKDSFEIILNSDTHPNYAAPVAAKNLRITSTFKFRWNRWHKGLDIGMPRGTPIMAVFDGKVRYAKFNSGGYGNIIIIRHYNGLETYYAHLDRLDVKVNQTIKAGQIIGLSGTAGTGPHLHFEVRIFGNAFNPYFIWNNKFDIKNNKLYISARLFYHQGKHSKSVSTISLTGESKKENKPGTNPAKKRRRNQNANYGTLKSEEIIKE